MNRGSLEQLIPNLALGAASMRPRFMNRGSLLAPEGVEPEAALASMRPRFMNRGSPLAFRDPDGVGPSLQ